MRQGRSDYDGIIDLTGRIPYDEPVFVLRAQDALAPELVRAWAERLEERGGASAMSAAARGWADEMEAWAREHGCKLPDAPEDVFA